MAELLIALAILGVIATFTIPKVLQSQNRNEWNAKAKEVAGMVSEAFIIYKQNNTLAADTGIHHLTPYLNYVSHETTAVIDNDPGHPGTSTCDSTPNDCYRLHNGALFSFGSGFPLGSTDPTAAMYFGLDPDGKVTGNSDSLAFVITAQGRVLTWGTAGPEIYVVGTPGPGSGTLDPSWFSWN